jgi:hypothetical protein
MDGSRLIHGKGEKQVYGVNQQQKAKNVGGNVNYNSGGPPALYLVLGMAVLIMGVIASLVVYQSKMTSERDSTGFPTPESRAVGQPPAPTPEMRPVAGATPAPGKRPPKLLVITAPRSNARVDDTATVSCETPFIGWRHYIIVTTPQRIRWVWPTEPTNGIDYSFSGLAQFGEGELGKSDSFEIVMMATKSAFKTGRLEITETYPQDARLSLPVTVRRAP